MEDNNEGQESVMKCNVRDLSEEGKKYEVRFYQKIPEDKDSQEEMEEEDKGKDVRVRMIKDSKSSIAIDPNSTTKIEYYEPTKKKKRNWFMRNFMCCS